VARLAGVSIKTVSRVLNREPNVRAETRTLVEQAIAELGFRPNVAARRLAGSRSFLLGLLVQDAAPAYTWGVQLGATRRCRGDGYHLMVEVVDAPDPVEQVRALARDLKLDGLILTPPVCDDPGVLDLLDELDLPSVRIAPGREPERTARVEVDDRGAAAAMTARLLDLGHREIAFVGGPTHHLAALRRYDGFRDAMAARGIEVAPHLVQHGDFSVRGGVEAGERLLGGPDRPSAIFAANDEMALGLLSAANRLGFRAPQDLSLAGFDGTPAGQSLWPPLTTVRQPLSEIGRTAAALLIEGGARDPEGGPVEVHLTCDLIPGGTAQERG
jgi:LacI family transcriptional regulator